MAEADTQKTKVCVIGAGNMGKHHVRNYSKMPGVELVAIADINPGAKKLAHEFGIAFFTDYERMLDECKPDAVSVVVPTPLHSRVGLQVMSRGIHCLLEKPIAASVLETDELIKCAKNNSVIFTVGHIEHYNPLVVKMRELLGAGTIGNITSLVSKRVGGFPMVEPKSDVILDLAVHDIGILNYLLDREPKRIFSHGSRTHHSNMIDSAEIFLDYGESSGFIQANWLTPVKIRTIAITGSKGYMEGNYINQELKIYEHNMEKYRDDDYSTFIFKMGEPKTKVINVAFKEPLALELQAFISHIQNTNSSKYLVSPQEAKYALEIALEALSSKS